MRLHYYIGASTAAAAACLLKAFHQRPNFYSATVYLSQSNACLLILTNLLLVAACSFLFALQRLFFGRLRPIEIEQLSEKAWYAVLDTLLAMPSFREDVGGWLLTMFVLILAGKLWGWIGEGRVDILEQQPPANPRLFHARLASSLLLSVAFAAYMLYFCVENVAADPRPGMMVIFTFEFAILLIFSLFTLLRYQLSCVEAYITKQQTKQAVEARTVEIRAERRAAAAAAAAQQSEAGETTTEGDAAAAVEELIEVDENEIDIPGWEEKRRWLFILEVLTDFFKLMIYLVFFIVSITFNGLPMHIMRDVYMTFASFSKRVRDYVAYRQATSDMNARYPDATTEEIRGDACIVCRESMIAWAQPAPQADAQPVGGQAEPPAVQPAWPQRRDEGLRAKKLPCGHILHLRCLKAWLERQQVCPTCRRPVVTASAPPAAGGAQPGAPAQPRAQQGRLRGRFFNFGPVRIGLANNEGQVRNMLNQLNADNRDAAQAANQQGPNHLGLPVPYANQPAGAQGGPPTNFVDVRRPRGAIPLQIQLLQIEQRLIQEACNLGLEYQQLATLRFMEEELNRLRGFYIPPRAMVSARGMTRPDALQPQGVAQPPSGPTAQAPFPRAFPPGVLHGNAQQQYSTGHESLPAGLVLPEGWTAIPLQPDRAATSGPRYNPTDPLVPTNGPSGFGVGSASAPPSGTESAGAGPATAPVAANPVPQQSTTGSASPTDDSGSPLFVPAQQPSASSLPADPAPSQPQPDASETAQRSETEQPHITAPWVPQGDWNFGGDSQSLQAQSSSHETTQPPQHEGKGKGKATEIEEVDDSGT